MFFGKKCGFLIARLHNVRYPREMRRFLGFLAICSLALPAHAVDGNLQMTLAQWQSLRDPAASGVVFADGVRFMAQHPGWPDEKIIRIRTEAAALFERPNPSVMAPYCENLPPISGRGMLACYRAGVGVAGTRDTWLHQGWVQGDFTETEERTVLADFGSELKQADHNARIDRLLYEKKIGPAKRMMGFMPTAKFPLYNARIAIISKDKKAPALLKAVPAADKRDTGLLFDCIGAAYDNKRGDTLVKLIRLAPAVTPYPDLWWPARNTAVRESISEHDYAQALTMLARHGDIKGEALSEALWLKGWITLQYIKEPATAYKDFRALYTKVNTPVSKARAAYWAARAATKNGNADIAREWMVKAAQHSTVFYGQLAQLSLDPNGSLDMPDAPTYSSQEKNEFDNDELVRVVRMLTDKSDTALRDRFLYHLATSANDAPHLLLVSNLARELNGVPGGVRVAKSALRKQVVLIDAGWPRIPLPENLGVEPALALAITRQESEFDVRAQSPANARGLMQLLPSTARHVAERNDWKYTDASLEDANANLSMGSAYLGQIIRGFDGSYILGIASYNAGPGTVRGWLKQRGNPPKNVNAAVDWIESIPYGETRNYVMRVLENTQVYRARMDPKAPLKLDDDLTR